MADKAKERPVLLISEGTNNSTQQVPIDRDEMTLGRGEECDIVLAERQVSRQHLRVYREGTRYYAEDLDSKNGTWVNGQQLKGSRELSDNDEIQLALAVRVKFVGSESTMPLGFEPPQNIGGRLRLDTEARRVFINEMEVDPPLSLPQYRLLELLYNNLGRICTRDSVVEAVWPEAMGEGVSEQAIDALVRRLRDRLSEVDPEHDYIMTIRGHGFRMKNVE